MLHDLNAGAAPDNKPFDVCVVGSGPAGITLALELAKKNKRVALCEAGGLEFSPDSQACYKGDVVGDPYFELDTARLRYFGGTSGHWTGFCHGLEDVDFAHKDRINPVANWPIGKKDLDPYLPGASTLLEIKPPPASKLLSTDQGIRQVFFSFSPPTRFGQKYRKQIVDSKNIVLFINANLTDTKASHGRVTSCAFRSYTGHKLEVSADKFVFAMGGIENNRQLLWQNAKTGGQLFSKDLPVGHYWMEHPHFTLGSALVDSELTNTRRFFSLTARKQAELGILNVGLRMEPLTDNGTKKLVRDLMCVAPSLGEKALEMAGRDLICGVRLRAAWEQEPRFDNRVALSPTKTDRFGAPLTTLYWRKSELDHKTIARSCAQFNEWLMKRKFGRLRLDSWVMGHEKYPTKDELAGYHHMGGARMSDSPRTGVVDQDCRVFGTKNLYVAGAAVFASGGHANPTLTIVQLALRLANHMAA